MSRRGAAVLAVDGGNSKVDIALVSRSGELMAFVNGPTISHHLKVLREAGVITGERRGTWIYYRVRTEMLAALSELLLPAEEVSA